nr:MAG TPA: hypothetical protein [Caudoviricetes sp.]
MFRKKFHIELFQCFQKCFFQMNHFPNNPCINLYNILYIRLNFSCFPFLVCHHQSRETIPRLTLQGGAFRLFMENAGKPVLLAQLFIIPEHIPGEHCKN